MVSGETDLIEWIEDAVVDTVSAASISHVVCDYVDHEILLMSGFALIQLEYVNIPFPSHVEPRTMPSGPMLGQSSY